MQEMSVRFLGRSAGEGIDYPLQYFWAPLVAQLVKNLPAMLETWVQSLSWEDTLEKGKVTHSSVLVWRTIQSMGSQRVRHNWATFTFISSVQSLNWVQLFVTPWTAALQASLSITNSQSLLKLMSIELVMPSNYLIPWQPFFLLPPNFPRIRVFSNESVLCLRWPKSWSFSFSISPSNEYSKLISFRMDWLDLLADQGTLKSLLQHHSSKASILHMVMWSGILISWRIFHSLLWSTQPKTLL